MKTCVCLWNGFYVTPALTGVCGAARRGRRGGGGGLVVGPPNKYLSGLTTEQASKVQEKAGPPACTRGLKY